MFEYVELGTSFLPLNAPITTKVAKMPPTHLTHVLLQNGISGVGAGTLNFRGEPRFGTFS